MIRHLAIIFMFIMSASAVHAYNGNDMDGLVTCKCKPVSGGYRYYVTIRNNELPATEVYVNGLDFLLSGGITDVMSPPLWSYSTDLFTGISWVESRGGENYRLGIGPSSSLSGFEFTSPKLKSQIQYNGFGDTDTIPLRFGGYAVPLLVPEPSSLVMLLGGLGSLGVGKAKYRRA